MTFILAGIGLGIFLIFYALMASAIIYHLNAYSLPNWNGRKVAIIAFALIALLLIGLLLATFFQVPWNSYARPTI